MQDTEDDIENVENQASCPQFLKCCTNKQAMRMHETVIHKLKHIAHAYLPGTNCQYCLREYRTKDKAIRHFKTTKNCLQRLRFYQPNGIRERAETAEGMELARQKAEPMTRLPGPLRWDNSHPIGPIPPPPRGYVTFEELAARLEIPNQDLEDQKWGTVVDLQEQAKNACISDITPFLEPIRAIILFYGGRRRQGYVAHFLCELSIARRAIEGFRLIVCVCVL